MPVVVSVKPLVTNKDILPSLSSLSISGVSPSPAVSGETLHSIMVPDEWGGVLHDKAWLNSLLNDGGVSNYVTQKSDEGNQPPTLSIETGAGPSGEDCLGVTVESGSNRLPGFWVIPGKNGTSGNRPTTWTSAHMIGGPSNTYLPNVHKIRMLCKWPDGYRISRASDLPPDHPNHDLFVFGNYIATETDIQAAEFESNNWHFYHIFWVRHDLGDGQWFTIDIGNKPQHQRKQTNGFLDPDAASPARRDTDGSLLAASGYSETDGYWGRVTRCYFDSQDYLESPEIALPYTMLVAGIWGVEDTRNPYYDITPIDYVDSTDYVLAPGNTRDFSFDITESRGVEDDCEFIINKGGNSETLLEGGSSVSSPLHFTANETKSLVLRLTMPDANWNVRASGVSFIPARQAEGTSSYWNRNDSNPWIENRYANKQSTILGDGQAEEVNHGDTMVYLKPS